MDASEIIDQITLANWLTARPEATHQRDSIWIATRAASRVFPLWGAAMEERWARNSNLSALLVLRLLLNSGVAAVHPSPAVSAAARTASLDVERASAAPRVMNGNMNAVAAMVAARSAVDTAYALHSAYASDAAYSAAYATGGWTPICEDAKAVEDRRDLFVEPLWLSPIPNWFADSEASTRNIWANETPVWSGDDQAPVWTGDDKPFWGRRGPWAFWIRWWDGVLSGHQLDWELQRRVALIPDAIWQSGPDAVAAEIAKIEEIFALLQQIADLKSQLREAERQDQASTATIAHRSHNRPPELLAPVTEVRREITVVFRALEAAEHELNQLAPSPSILQRAGEVLLAAGKSIALYCGGLADVALKKAAEEIGSTGVKLAIFAAATYYASQALPIQSVGKALLDLTVKLVSGG